MSTRQKLRYVWEGVPFRVVLVEPEIPPNTGAVARTCVATSSPLHLVGPLGFDISDHAVRRAGLDYWPLLDLHRHDDFDEFAAEFPDARPTFFSANARRSYFDSSNRESAPAPGDALIFGRESVGLPEELLERRPDRVFAIPTAGGVRSLNLSNAVSIALYEALRASGALAHTALE